MAGDNAGRSRGEALGNTARSRIPKKGTIGVAVFDEGVLVDAETVALDFVGSGVTATGAGDGLVTVDVTGGGTGPRMQWTTINEPNPPARRCVPCDVTASDYNGNLPDPAGLADAVKITFKILAGGGIGGNRMVWTPLGGALVQEPGPPGGPPGPPGPSADAGGAFRAITFKLRQSQAPDFAPPTWWVVSDE